MKQEKQNWAGGTEVKSTNTLIVSAYLFHCVLIKLPGSNLSWSSGPEMGKGYQSKEDSDHQVDCTQLAPNSLSHLYLYI